MSRAYLNAISYYLPENILDNTIIADAHPEWSIEKISQKTGINNRYISAEDEFSSDMAIKAAQKLFAEYSINVSDIDYLILCTQSPDYFLPTTACIIQNELGLSKNIGALDINLGCSGFVYGLGLAKGLIVTKQAKNILLITSETYSKFIHPSDKSNKTIFGDAAACTLISDTPSTTNLSGSIEDFVYGTDGSGYKDLIVRNGGMRNRFKKGLDNIDSEGSFISNDDYLFMDGKSIFSFTAFNVPQLVKDVCIKNQLTENEVDLYIFHQANLFMLQTMRKRCNISEEKFYTHLDCANTVSSTIPIALKTALSQNKISKGSKVLLAGFGVGLSLGGVIINY